MQLPVDPVRCVPHGPLPFLLILPWVCVPYDTYLPTVLHHTTDLRPVAVSSMYLACDTTCDAFPTFAYFNATALDRIAVFCVALRYRFHLHLRFTNAAGAIHYVGGRCCYTRYYRCNACTLDR